MTPSKPASPPLILLIMMAATSVLSLNIFVPSLPDMAADFGVSVGLMSWSFSGYLLVIATLQLVIGPLSDLLGRRPLVLLCFGMFTAASFGCAFAPTVEIFFVFRVLQAVAVGGMTLVQAIVRDTAVDQDQAASRIALVTMIMAIAPMMGPALGGSLAEVFGWRSNFVFLGCSGAVVFCVAFLVLPETNLNKTETFRKQLKAYPLLLSKPRYWGFALTMMLSAGMFYVFLIALPIVGKAEFGLSPRTIGLLLAILPLGYIIGNNFTRMMVKNQGVSKLIFWGRVCCLIGILAAMGLWFAGVKSPYIVFMPLVIIGIGNGLMTPSAVAGAVSVAPKLAGTASGLGGSITQYAGAGLTALAGYLIQPNPTPSFLLGLLLFLCIVNFGPSLLLHLTRPAEKSPIA